MMDRLQNPQDLLICLKMLNVISLSDHDSEKRIDKIVSKHLGNCYEEFSKAASKQLLTSTDDQKVKLTRESLTRLQEEDAACKKEILLMFEEIIFADEEVLSSERKFYDIAKSLLQVNTYEIEPSVELFEYLNVLNYVSSSDFASIDEFAEIWIKYMGPDIRVYYNEAYQNLKDLDLESQIQKVGGNLRKLNNIDDQQKISIRKMVEEIIFSDEEFTDEEKIVYELLLENLGVAPGIEYNQPNSNPLRWLSNIEQSQWFQNFINSLIVLTGVVVGLETSEELVRDYPTLFYSIDTAIKYIFLVEVLVRFLPKWHKPLSFFSDGWNIFDTLLVIGSFLPFGSYPFILRVIRLLRFTRIFRQVPQLRIIVISLLQSTKPIGFVGVLLLLLIYIYGVFGTTAFSKNDPIHFRDLPISMISLFRAATFEDWTDLMYIQMYSCAEYGYGDNPELCTNPMKMPMTSALYFISFIIISGLVILNLVIGVIIQSMTQAKSSLEKDEELRKTIKNIDFIVKKVRARKFEEILDTKDSQT
jgi:voltage-gated sodium channel